MDSNKSDIVNMLIVNAFRLDDNHFDALMSKLNQRRNYLILNELLGNQKEIINSPIRFNGVHIEKIKEVFGKYGILEEINF